MIKLGIDTYFAKKGISVRYNTLGNNEDLVHSYLEQFQHIVNNSVKRKSHHVKHRCYSELYNIEPRTKYTGFENFKKIDIQFRKDLSANIYIPQHDSVGFVVDHKNSNTTKSYKELLISSIKSLNYPVLYLSGGIDSELVALALLESNTKFIPVIFEYIDNQGTVQNNLELQYAYKFCKENSLIPEIVQLNIESLWNSEHFKKLAVDLQILSPQIVTHVYMIELMSMKYRHNTHLLGGEIRFDSDYIMDNGDFANLVFLNKVNPPGYNGNIYTFEGGFTASVTLNYYTDGSWSVVGPAGNPLGSGFFTDTPAFLYQARVSTVNVIINTPNIGSTTHFPSAPEPVFHDIDGTAGGTLVCTVGATADDGDFAKILVSYGIECRSANEPGIVVSSTIGLEAIADLR